MTYMNIMLFFVSVYLFVAGGVVSDLHKESEFDVDVARLAVSEKITSLSRISTSALKVKQSCVQPDQGGGTVIGEAEALTSMRVIDGVPMSDQTLVSYRAKVSSHCWKYNLNCYEIDNIELQGKRSIYPQI